MIRSLLLLLIPISSICQNNLVPDNFNSSIPQETYAVRQENGLTVFFECLEVNKDQMIFDLEIKNESGKIFEFDPEEIYYYRSNIPFQEYGEENWEYYFLNESQDNFRTYAKSIHEVNDYYRKKIRSKENTKTMLAILGTALIVYDAVKDGQDFAHEPTRNRVARSITRDATLTASMAALDIAGSKLTQDQIKSDEDLYYLSEEYLPTTTLADKASMRGKVYFSKNIRYEFYRVIVPVDEWAFTFDFRWPTNDERRAIRNSEKF